MTTIRIDFSITTRGSLTGRWWISKSIVDALTQTRKNLTTFGNKPTTMDNPKTIRKLKILQKLLKAGEIENFEQISLLYHNRSS